MAAYQTKKNLLQDRDTYNRYYGDFRGVDFSSDHTQVHEQRLAYAVNMYKDYQSGQGEALETIPGFRRRVELPDEIDESNKPYKPEVYGIHRLDLNENGVTVPKVLIHADNKLYLWHNYPRSIGVSVSGTAVLGDEVGNMNGLKYFEVVLGDDVCSVQSVTLPNGEAVLNFEYIADTRTLGISSSAASSGDSLNISYHEGEMQKALFENMNTRKSCSFVFNNRLYIIDGKNYLVYDGKEVQSVATAAYVPTTYINIIPGGTNADAGVEYEQRNVLQPKFKNTFIGDGTTKSYYLNEHDLDSINEVEVYGNLLTPDERDPETNALIKKGDYYVDSTKGIVTFRVAPSKPEYRQYTDPETNVTSYYPEAYAGIEITASKSISYVSGVTDGKTAMSEIVCGCTIAAVFDGRVFLSGNPAYPNHIFYCERNDTGYADPSYFGALNYMQDGVSNYPVTGMIPVADSLMVLKSEARQDGAVYFHSPSETGLNLQPKVYPSTQGLNGIGCLGACVNFLDDPVFVSRLGLEAVGQLSVRYERAIEHRSSLIDAKLVNLDLTNASLEEWNGYLILLVDGKIFMADSRQRYTHESGNMQYEWYYLEDIGVCRGQYPEYRYASEMRATVKYCTKCDIAAASCTCGDDENHILKPLEIEYCTECGKTAASCTCGDDESHITIPLKLADNVYDPNLCEYQDLTGQVANPPNEEGKSTKEIFEQISTLNFGDTEYSTKIYFTVQKTADGSGYEAYLCEAKGNKTGGIFKGASVVRSMDDNLFFGTANGVICSFNFDMRDERGEIPQRYYSFDGRTIFCGCATKMDCCGIPHLTKNTIKKSTVIKTKSLQTSAAKIKVRTNKKPYSQIARINSTIFSFDNMDFSDFSFTTTEQSLFAVKEKEKKWVEKQYFLYSDEYMKPFALYYISYRYCIAGRYKE